MFDKSLKTLILLICCILAYYSDIQAPVPIQLFLPFCLSHTRCVCVSCRDADALTVSNCTTEKKKELFTIAKQAFTTSTRSETVPVSTFQLMTSYLGRQTHAHTCTHIQTHTQHLRMQKTSIKHKQLKWNSLFFLSWPAAGADSDYIKSLSSSNVNMDMATFVSLDESVVLVSCVFVCVYVGCL